MNQDETRALWDRGVDAWNAWALKALEGKQVLEQAGDWSVDWFGEGLNEKTQVWLADTKADFEGLEFASDANFCGFAFPGQVIFNGAHFIGEADFTDARFANMAHFHGTHFDGVAKFKKAEFIGLANFDDAAFASEAEFESTQFLRETTGPLVPAARFQKTQFGSRADFRNSVFVGMIECVKTQFSGNARFDEAVLKADAIFDGAIFDGTAGFVKTQFKGTAKFNAVQFHKDARFGESGFEGPVHFEDTEFADNATFRFVKFGGDTTFQKASFAKEARFTETQFTESAIFRSVEFEGSADFSSCAFAKAVDFHRCKFVDDVIFDKAVFSHFAEFPSAKFRAQASFAEAVFHDSVSFLMATFRGRTSFRDVAFTGSADFSGVQSRAAFVLSGAQFETVPDFHDASFRDPPSLDSMNIVDPVSYRPARNSDTKKDPRGLLFRLMRACSDRAYAARYRRLGKLAAATQDFEREREFFSQELRCRRFWHDKPIGKGMGRFWLGWIYGGVSNFGRSLVRPVLLWMLSILGFALLYLGIRRGDYFEISAGPVSDAAITFPVWPVDTNLTAIAEWAASAVQWAILSIFGLFAGGGCISGETGASGEALFLSLKNSLFFFGWESPDAARRVYSCLYGFESVSSTGESLVRVPLNVSVAAIIENMIGLTFIILFVIAVRNLLRTR